MWFFYYYLFDVHVCLSDVCSLCFVWGPGHGCGATDFGANRCNQTNMHRIPWLWTGHFHSGYGTHCLVTKPSDQYIDCYASKLIKERQIFWIMKVCLFAELKDSMTRRKIACLISIEGGHSIDSSLPALRMFYQLGVRSMSLTHSCNTPWYSIKHAVSKHHISYLLDVNPILETSSVWTYFE